MDINIIWEGGILKLLVLWRCWKDFSLGLTAVEFKRYSARPTGVHA
jgi:hypothetical protein